MVGGERGEDNTLDWGQESLGPSPSSDPHCCVTQESHCPLLALGFLEARSQSHLLLRGCFQHNQWLGLDPRKLAQEPVKPGASGRKTALNLTLSLPFDRGKDLMPISQVKKQDRRLRGSVIIPFL